MIKQTIIFGGTFDPIHYGHLILAECLARKDFVDKVLFLPNGHPPHKKYISTNNSQRLEMLSLAINDNPSFGICNFELDSKKENYTFDTLNSLSKIYENFSFLIGSDSLLNIKSWYRSKELIERFNFIAVPRIIDKKKFDKFEFDVWKEDNASFASSFKFIETPIIEISSSIIRGYLNNRKTVKYLLPEKVIDYIDKNNLYI